MAETIPERSAAVQARVNAYVEKHREELRRINALSPEEQEQEFSARINKEIERISQMAPQSPEKELDTLVLIALETDRILMLDPDRQQKVIAAKYTLDPKALIDHYPELQTQALELQQKLAAAERNTAFMGWGALAGTIAATLIRFGKDKKNLANRFSGGNRLIKWFFVSLASLGMGFGGSFVGSRLFGSKVREDSKALVTEARVALENELAAAIGNKVREDIALATASKAPAAPAPDFKAGVERKALPQPREGFALEAVKEKAASQAASAGIG